MGPNERLSVEFIKTHTTPIKLVFFGSIVREDFDAWSDIDIIAIYSSAESAYKARRILYSKPLPMVGHPLEIICVDEDTFTRKAAVGGIYFVAKNEGFSAST